jgi:tetratricopeptide (TPR) repeat protein
MLHDLLPGDLPAELPATIVERSEGNPLYVEEIVRVLIDDGVLRATKGSGWELARRVEDVELPRSIQGLIAARLDGLPEDEKAVLQDAAVVGRGFWTGAVARLAGRDVAAVREALGRLRVKELVVPHEPSSFSDEQEFAFRHLLIRDGAYESLPKALRAEKHAEVARWAEERAGDRAEEIAELIATHYLEALRYEDELGGGEHGDLERTAYRWARAAGDRANALWLRAEAVRWYREALRLGELADVPAADRAAIAKAHTRAAWGTVATEETERAGRHALSLFEAAGDELGAGWAQSQLVLPLFQQGKDEEAQRAGEKAVARLQSLGETPELAEALHLLGWYHWRRGHADETELPLRRSIAMATRVDAGLVRAAAMQTLAVQLLTIGRTEEGLVMIEEAYRLAKEVGESGNLLRIYNNLPSTLGDYASDYRRASEFAREGLELARKAGSIGNTGWILGTLGDLTDVLGDLPAAEDMQREAIEVATAAGDEPLLGMRRQALAWTLTQRGRLDEAEESFQLAVDMMREIPEVQYELWACSTKSVLAELRGRDEEAIQELRRGVDLARAYNVDQVPLIFLELVRMLVRAGDREAAGKYTDLTDRARAPFARACAVAVEGLLAESPVESIRLLQDAAEKVDALGVRVELARVLLDQGRAMRRAGENPRAMFERARDLLIECDARLFLPEAEAELASEA